jgi:hypothetical protein
MKNIKTITLSILLCSLIPLMTTGCGETDDNNTTTLSNNNDTTHNNQNNDINTTIDNNISTLASFDANSMDVSKCTVLDSYYISSDKTFGDSCYKIMEPITLYGGATLTIKPGTVLFFDSDAYLSVGGTLNAVGTKEKPIIFTGLEKTAGYWRGLRISNSDTTDNKLSNIIVEYAGKGVYGCGVDISGSRVKITDSLFRYNKDYGFCIDSYSKISEFKRVSSVFNTKSAGKLHPTILGSIDSESNFTENKNNYITITGGTIYGGDVTWNKLSVPVFVDEDIDLDNEATLTIKPGARFIMNSGVRFTTKGIIKAIGKGEYIDKESGKKISAEPILFTGAEKTPGYWGGINIDSDSIKNELSNVILEYGGGDSGINNVLLNVWDSRLKISDSILRYSSGDGFYVGTDGKIGKFERVTSTGNLKSAGKIYPHTLSKISSTNDFSGNKKDYLTVMSGRVTNDATWYPLNVPIMFTGDVAIDDVKLTIKPGTFMKFDSVSLEISGGIIKAIGTPAKPIIFTGSQDVPGQWRGIYFYLSDSAENEIAYSHVSYGGGQLSGNIYVGQGSRANIHDNVITDSASYGVSVNSLKPNPINRDVETSNSFANNAKGNVHIE